MTKVKCMICGEEFERINNFHLKTHGITHKEYCEMFPSTPLISEEMRKHISEIRIGRTKENDEGVRKAAEKYKEICKNPTVAMIEGRKRAAEKLTGKTPTPAMIEGRKRQSEKMTGQTKENNKSVRKMSETLTGRTKEDYEYLREAGEKRTGRTKENDEGVKKMAETLTGRTKENHEGVRRGAEKKKGRTKENHEGIRIVAEKLTKQIGELNPNWRGGISFEPYCPKFDEDLKERVREFFGKCCYICGIGESETGQKLDVHHVNYQKMACCEEEIKPLFVPLCRKCHGKTHGDREYWEEFFTISLEYLTDGECFYSKEELICKNDSYKKRI